MSKVLPYSMQDVGYDNDKFRPRSYIQGISQAFATKNIKRSCAKCTTGRFLLLLMICGVIYLITVHKTPVHSRSTGSLDGVTSGGQRTQTNPGGSRIGRLLRNLQGFLHKAFVHAWSGYKNYAMGYDELMPLSRRGTDGLGGLGATVVDSLDTAIIMGIDDVVSDAGTWIQNLSERINQKGQVNLFETTIRVLGGLLSAYHLQGGDPGTLADMGIPAHVEGPKAKSTWKQLRTWQTGSYLLLPAMKVFEHLKTLPKVQGLVPIYIRFSGENIRLGSRGDSYYEYLIKVWLHQGGSRNSRLKYLHDMYEEAMKGVMNLLLRKSIPKGLVFVGELPYGHGGGFSPKMDHLVCFLPGTLALGATKGITRRRALKDKLLTADDVKNLQLAEDLAKTCFEMYSVTATGLAPEIAYFHIESSEYVNDITIKHADRHNLLRPETVESLFVLYRITEDPKYREWGWRIFEAFERHTKVDSGGYSSLDDVTVVPAHRRDKMETFFLGETLKYLYLLFGDSNVLPLDKFVFNTEAHPLPIRRVPN
ncbi:unnamed protein product [Spirodela intermedia]|uniref:alpha-1,2-Mannosidase n=1 Tax=Spirodela intermedia TaxID=51605 RepID=A0A7I8JTV0_SPIIN|nr:unnamed protein product [Spirodela intermedia]CAA6673181.1 unnamed protein product [Spirodela intermedia]